MNRAEILTLGALAGGSIFLGLPVARTRRVSQSIKGFLNAVATGILIFLLWDVVSQADQPVVLALAAVHHGQLGTFLALIAIFAVGITVGLLSLVYFDKTMAPRLGLRGRPAAGPGATAAPGTLVPPVTSGRTMALMIAAGLGLHNLSEGLAIGQSAAGGAITFATILVIGFGLHNITEGFGIAAPLALEPSRPSWRFLLLAGAVGGGPTFLGTAIGSVAHSQYLFVLFLTLATGALVYVIGEMFHVGRRMNPSVVLAWGILLGFLAAYSTDLLLTYLGA